MCSPLGLRLGRTCMSPDPLNSVAAAPLEFGFCSDKSLKNSFAARRFVKPHIRKLYIHL
jgi:hypothetical protein